MRPAFAAIATAAGALAAYVAASLLLKTLAEMALERFDLTEDAVGRFGEFILTAALAMSAVDKGLDLLGARRHGRAVFAAFAAMSLLSLALAMGSGVMRVDFLGSLLRMSAVCLFAYWLFWNRPGRISSSPE